MEANPKVAAIERIVTSSWAAGVSPVPSGASVHGTGTREARKMMHHEHGQPGAGPKAHAAGLGHKHTMGAGPGQGGGEPKKHGE